MIRYICRVLFQSTLPVRGATLQPDNLGGIDGFQSTLPVRGATGGRIFFPPSGVISIHAPREGSDHNTGLIVHMTETISIHAPREGSDDETIGPILGKYDFNPRSP